MSSYAGVGASWRIADRDVDSGDDGTIELETDIADGDRIVSWRFPTAGGGAGIAEAPVAVCVEGPARRTAPRQLLALASALPSLGVNFQIVAVLSGRSLKECQDGRRLYTDVLATAINKPVVYFECVVDAPLPQVRDAFLSASKNATWWTTQEWRFTYQRPWDTMNFPKLLQNLRMKSRCLAAVRAAELSSLSTFRWAIYVRSDLLFLAGHPPISSIEPLGGIWLPDGQDHGGVNDRWAVVARTHWDAYFGRWEAFIDSTALAYLDSLFLWDEDAAGLNPEYCLLLHLHHLGLWPKHVHRFVPTGALICIDRDDKDCELKLTDGANQDWRSEPEWADAYSAALRLRNDGWRWGLVEKRELQPACEVSIACCGASPASGLSFACFDGTFFTQNRCCDGAGPLLTPVAVAESTLSQCWSLNPFNALRLDLALTVCVVGS